MKYYLAYGSNMNLPQMALRCPTAKVVGATMLDGWRLQFNGVATIVPESGAQTPVVVWAIQEQDERNLDRYEGYPTFYFKKDLTVKLNGEKITAMAYIMAAGHEEAEPSAFYYRTIEAGYKSARLSDHPLISAYQRARYK